MFILQKGLSNSTGTKKALHVNSKVTLTVNGNFCSSFSRNEHERSFLSTRRDGVHSLTYRTNLWKNTASVLERYNGIDQKARHTFVVFDIVDFDASITEDLLRKAIFFAQQDVEVSEEEITIIMHARKSLLFNNDQAWIKKENSDFDVTMGSYDGAEVCQLVGAFLLSRLEPLFGKKNVGLYRDDGLSVLKDVPPGTTGGPCA